MTGRLLSLSVQDGRQQITLELLDRDFSAAFQELASRPVEVEIKPLRKRRSLDANAYFWVLAGKLAASLGIAPEEVYRAYIPQIGGNYEVVTVAEDGAETLREHWESHGKGWLTEPLPPPPEPGWSTLLLYCGSSVYDTAQMTRLIDLAVQDCKENGIETLPPDKLAAMTAAWAPNFKNP